jgi:hypothetical protein
MTNNESRLAKYRKTYKDKKTKAGFAYAGFWLHESYADEIKELIKAKNSEIGARQILSLPIVKVM